jgi:hypothetical protein
MPKQPHNSSSHRTQKHPETAVKSVNVGGPGLQSGQPIFGQPKPSPDPTGFKNPVTDQKSQGIRHLEPVPQPRGGAVEPILTLAQVYGSAGKAKIAALEQAGQIVFNRSETQAALLAPRHSPWWRTRW